MQTLCVTRWLEYVRIQLSMLSLDIRVQWYMYMATRFFTLTYLSTNRFLSKTPDSFGSINVIIYLPFHCKSNGCIILLPYIEAAFYFINFNIKETLYRIDFSKRKSGLNLNETK